MSRSVQVVLGVLMCCVVAGFAWEFATIPAPPLMATEASAPRVIRRARPIGLAYLFAEQRLLVANRDSGTITTIDPESRRVIDTWQVPGADQLADFIVSEDGKYLVTCSVTQNKVWLIQRVSDHEFAVLETLTVPAGPVGLRWLPGKDSKERELAVACQWGRAVVLARFQPGAAEGSRLVMRLAVSLPHAPRKMLSIQQGTRLLVADAFGGSISGIKTDSGTLERTKQLPGHNLHGLEMMPDNDRVIIAHQILNPIAETSRDGVFWGIVMTNNLRLVPVENFLRDDRELLEGADVHFLGQPNHGAADPTAVAVGRYETMLTTLGGVDELAVGVHLDHTFDRVKVGRRPVAVVTNKVGEIAYVANQFSDSVSVVEIKTRKVVGEIPLLEASQNAAPTLVEQGEILFHDAGLSLDKWYSCHSCHSSGHTVGLLNDNLGDGNYGAPKRIPSLLGVNDTAPFLWSGRRDDLIEQTRKSITTTMHGEDPDDGQLRAIVAYMQTLSPPPRIAPADEAQVTRGAKVFEDHGCVKCHAPPTFTSTEIYDVGIKDQHGRVEFNPPSLRGVRHRGPFFHDHRASSLKEVLTTHKHPRATEWSGGELDDLIAFLESL